MKTLLVDQQAMPALGQLLPRTAKPSPNYVKHAPAEPEMRAGLTVVNGRLAFDPFKSEKPPEPEPVPTGYVGVDLAREYSDTYYVNCVANPGLFTLSSCKSSSMPLQEWIEQAAQLTQQQSELWKQALAGKK